jgi:hypothetical protein
MRQFSFAESKPIKIIFEINIWYMQMYFSSTCTKLKSWMKTNGTNMKYMILQQSDNGTNVVSKWSQVIFEFYELYHSQIQVHTKPPKQKDAVQQGNCIT